MLIIKILLFLGAGVFIYIGIIFFYPNIELIIHGIEAKGQVIDIIQKENTNRHFHEHEYFYAPVIKYQCNTKLIEKRTETFSYPNNYKIGDQVDVLCLVGNPEKYIINTLEEKYFGLIFIMTGFRIGVARYYFKDLD